MNRFLRVYKNVGKVLVTQGERRQFKYKFLFAYSLMLVCVVNSFIAFLPYNAYIIVVYLNY